MSIKHRVRALEIELKVNMGKEPWLTFDIDGNPTIEQQKSMDEAERLGKKYICFIAQGDTIYLSCLKEHPPWQKLGK